MTRTFAELQLEMQELDFGLEIRTIERQVQTKNGVETFPEYKINWNKMRDRVERIKRLIRIAEIEINHGLTSKSYISMINDFEKVLKKDKKESELEYEALIRNSHDHLSMRILTIDNKYIYRDASPEIEIMGPVLNEKKKLVSSIIKLLDDKIPNGIKIESKFSDSITRNKLREYLLNIVEQSQKEKVNEFIEALPEFKMGRGTKGLEYYKSQIPKSVLNKFSNDLLKLELDKVQAVKAIKKLEEIGVLMPVQGYKDKLYQNVFAYLDKDAEMYCGFSTDIRTIRSKVNSK